MTINRTEEPQEPQTVSAFHTRYLGRDYYDTPLSNSGTHRAQIKYLEDWKRWAESELKRLTAPTGNLPVAIDDERTILIYGIRFHMSFFKSLGDGPLGSVYQITDRNGDCVMVRQVSTYGQWREAKEKFRKHLSIECAISDVEKSWVMCAYDEAHPEPTMENQAKEKAT